jgi:hypothetical protein
MSRIMITMVLILALNLIGSGSPAVAFTVRFGPMPASEAPIVGNAAADNDVPTPQMLKVTIGADGMTFGPIQPAPEPMPIVPTLRIRDRAPSGIDDEQAAPLVHNLTPPRQLRGAEIMLLRDVKHVATR